MSRKRQEAARTRGVGARAPAAAGDPERDVIPWLRSLGFRADEARQAAAFCESMTDASLEERVRAALGYLRPRASSTGHAVNVGTAA